MKNEKYKKRSRIVTALPVLFLIKTPFIAAARFSINGPSLTVTLKDPNSSVVSLSSPLPPNYNGRQGYASYFPNDDKEQAIEEKKSTNDEADFSTPTNESSAMNRIVNISGLNPALTWGIKSLGLPFPNYAPFIKSLSFNSGYKYTDNRYNTNEISNKLQQNRLKRRSLAESYVEGNLKLGTFLEGIANLVVNINPSYHFHEKTSNLLITMGTSGSSTAVNSEGNKVDQVQQDSHAKPMMTGGTGGFFGLLRFSSKGKKLLEYARATYKASLPFTTVQSISVTPSIDLSSLSQVSSMAKVELVIEGESGTGRTSTILNLKSYGDSTLTVVHALDSKNIIAPEISLSSAKILYHWDVSLDNGGSIRTRVDPTSAIQVVWTDVKGFGNRDDDHNIGNTGKWITEFKLPLDGRMGAANGGTYNAGIFAADIRVRRQFQF